MDGEEVARPYAAMRSVLNEAIDVEMHDWLRVAVRGKASQLYPLYGNLISEVKRQHVATHFCRTYQLA